MCTKDQILDAISKMSVIDIAELISMIEIKFDVKYIVSDGNSEKKISSKEKNEFDVYLNAVGKNKIAVIKYIRSILNLGLKEAKDLVESAPVILKKNINKNDSLLYKKSLEEIGAFIDIK